MNELTSLAGSTDLLAQAAVIEAEADRLRAQASELRSQAQTAREREHQERLAADAEYRAEQDELRACHLEHITDLLARRMPPVKDTRRVGGRFVSTDLADTIAINWAGYQVRVCANDDRDGQLALVSIGPRGGRHGYKPLPATAAAALADALSDIIGAIPDAYLNREEIAVEVADGRNGWWLRFDPATTVTTLGHDRNLGVIDISAGCLADFAALLRRPVTTTLRG